MVDETTTTSLLDSTEEIRIIRSHRAPRTTRHRRTAALVLTAVIATGGLSGTAPTSGMPAVAEARATAMEAVTETLAPDRAHTVSRALARATTRKAKIENVIKFALAQRGDRYRWGAAGPSRWDCSGLVMKSFSKAGVKLPHYTGAIQKKGKRVSKKNLQRGDIIFPQRGHVGIYLGNGKMVHASSSKGKVVVSKVYGFYTARRVL